MLEHKGGQINNVQLITGLRIAEMSQLQNCSVKWSSIPRMEGGGGSGQGGGVRLGGSGWMGTEN